MSKKDNINPPYYRKAIEVADFIEAYDMDYFSGNVVKYICRYKEKNGLEDLLKAKWYLERVIKKYEH